MNIKNMNDYYKARTRLAHLRGQAKALGALRVRILEDITSLDKETDELVDVINKYEANIIKKDLPS